MSRAGSRARASRKAPTYIIHTGGDNSSAFDGNICLRKAFAADNMYKSGTNKARWAKSDAQTATKLPSDRLGDWNKSSKDVRIRLRN